MHKAGNYIRDQDHSEQKLSKRAGSWQSWNRRGGRVSAGHVPYGLFRKHMPEDTRYMTFLREPVDRVLSHYYRHIHTEDQFRASWVKTRPGARVKAGSIEQAMIEMRLPQLNNLSTRFLSGHDPMAELPDSALDDAKEHLSGFAFVGIQERFEESVVLLQRLLGLGTVPPYIDLARERSRRSSIRQRGPSRAACRDRRLQPARRRSLRIRAWVVREGRRRGRRRARGRGGGPPRP